MARRGRLRGEQSRQKVHDVCIATRGLTKRKAPVSNTETRLKTKQRIRCNNNNNNNIDAFPVKRLSIHFVLELPDSKPLNHNGNLVERECLATKNYSRNEPEKFLVWPIPGCSAPRPRIPCQTRPLRKRRAFLRIHRFQRKRPRPPKNRLRPSCFLRCRWGCCGRRWR